MAARSQLPERPRHQGDGAISPEQIQYTERVSHSKPFSVNVNINVIQVCLLIASLATRLWQLGHPRAVVFDELHFTRFVAMYMKRIFFFDFNPPLGKLILAATASLMGYAGEEEYDRIGAEYSHNMPMYQLRLVPALCGSLLVPMVYQIIVEIGLSHWTALCAALLILLDNAVVVQSRFILIESILMLFAGASFICLLKFRQQYHRPFSVRWCVYLTLTGVSIAATVSTKYIGVLTAVLILFVVCQDYWWMMADASKTSAILVKGLLARLACLVVLPCGLYVAIFYVHLGMLTRAGPHDNVMTSAFQASLEGGLASITKGQPLRIAYGSQITLRHTHGRPCWLHSHLNVYPIRYESELGSSHQQQVTCYYFKDINNWWIVKHPDRNRLLVDDPPQVVRHGDIIQLVHGTTHRALNTHDVAAPISPRCQEVSCYIDYNVSMPAQNLWRVEVTNGNGGSATWQTIQSVVKLVHVNTSAALKVTWKHLPEWGFKQLEVAADRDVTGDDTLWNVEEHRYSKTHATSDDDKIDLSDAQLIPTEPTYMSFWAKFVELHMKLATHEDTGIAEHRYSSSPVEWPFMTRNVAYWLSPDSNAQIHLIGNPVVWYAATLSIPVALILLTYHLMRRRRKHFDLTEDEWQQFILVLQLTVAAYIVHLLPYLMTDQILFLHHYLPLVIYKVMALAAITEHGYKFVCRHKKWRLCYQYTVLVYLSLVAWAFFKLSVFTYGKCDLTAQDFKNLQWKDSWDFIEHK